MPDFDKAPEVSSRPVLALFRDIQTARTAIETMLQGGFLGEQLALVVADDSVLSPANDLKTYRATGFMDSGSELGQDRRADGDANRALEAYERDLRKLRDHAAVVSVQVAAGQEANAREMLTSLGGRLLRTDGTLETEAA
ncbi:MAG TPA: hypothetical protein VMZ25_00935 [Terriglobales bacterium]|nr:hypothetical protein [Terriglobales bacterium]